MDYEIELTAHAEKQRGRFSPWLRDIVDELLLDLGRSPWAKSRPVVSPPYPPGGMMSESDHCDADGIFHHIAVFFRYKNESVLVVNGIGHTEYEKYETD